MKRLITLTAVVATCLLACGQNVSGLDSKNFSKWWIVESESPDYRVTFSGDTAEIVAPKGLTLWRKEKMSGKVTIEYDAQVVVENENDRLSDLNCFWMASDPQCPDDITRRAKWRSGVFVNCYSLQLYYLGYGGNHNTTTRFRRYDGNEAGVTDAEARPAILREYTDEDHLLKANHWYHIKLTSEGGKVCYYIDGLRLVDFRDADPLTEGWFGFRTTLSRTRITNFSYRCEPLKPSVAELAWVGGVPEQEKAVSFGVPFDEGEISSYDAVRLTTDGAGQVPLDTWTLAYWPDGSVKWLGVAAVIPACTSRLTLEKSVRKEKAAPASGALKVSQTDDGIKVNTGVIEAYIPKSGENLIDSLVCSGVTVARGARLLCSTQSQPLLDATDAVTFTHYVSRLKSAEVERAGNVRALVKLTGVLADGKGREWLPFTVRLYFYQGSQQVKMIHSFIFDGDQDKDFIHSLGVRFDVPMRDELYNRHVAFSCADGGVWSEPVQPLSGRRVLSLDPDNSRDPDVQRRQMLGERVPPRGAFDDKGKHLIDNWASWDSYRLSQLSADAFSIRKRANDDNPWIGTFSGTRADGYAFAGDVTGGLGVRLHDFWQSYPSSLEINGAKSGCATLTAWLWSPEAEAMDLRHYDNVAHGLQASYEDVQEGLSTPYGIARTTTLTLLPQLGYKGKEAFAADAALLSGTSVLLPTPEYLHSRRAFGIWSLPDRSNSFRARVEDRLDEYVSFYKRAIEDNKWYGFWNYGDVMHDYDHVRHCWMYDVGGFAWDNTELASNMWLWYGFLRTGREDIWRMAEAMTRHTCEVDVYHLGPNAGLGSRHNVSHWGCGAKEARVSQAAWNHFYHYLTTDERAGDLMTEVKDAHLKLYTLDPMRLAEPRDKFPCTAPARLRFGPDWIAYASNWMLEWERTRDEHYLNMILAGMKSICALPSRLFTGPLALGFDPATGVITTECDPQLQTTNHLMTIMGGFEMMNEMMRMVRVPEWEDAWLELAANYKRKAMEIRHNAFRVSRLQSYAAYRLRSPELAAEAWIDLMRNADLGVGETVPPEVPAPVAEGRITTNDAALWSLDAIYMQEVIPVEDAAEK